MSPNFRGALSIIAGLLAFICLGLSCSAEVPAQEIKSNSSEV